MCVYVCVCVRVYVCGFVCVFVWCVYVCMCVGAVSYRLLRVHVTVLLERRRGKRFVGTVWGRGWSGAESVGIAR